MFFWFFFPRILWELVHSGTFPRFSLERRWWKNLEWAQRGFEGWLGRKDGGGKRILWGRVQWIWSCFLEDWQGRSAMLQRWLCYFSHLFVVILNARIPWLWRYQTQTVKAHRRFSARLLSKLFFSITQILGEMASFWHSFFCFSWCLNRTSSCLILNCTFWRWNYIHYIDAVCRKSIAVNSVKLKGTTPLQMPCFPRTIKP